MIKTKSKIKVKVGITDMFIDFVSYNAKKEYINIDSSINPNFI